MSKAYTLQGPIVLENLTNAQAMTFLAAVINAIPSYSMGTASMHIRAQGPATANGETAGVTVGGSSLDQLKASLANANATPAAPEDITYDVLGNVNLVDLSFEDGMQVIMAAMNNIPPDALVVTAMIAQQQAQS